MDEYIDKAKLYEQIAEREELARDRALDTPATMPFPIYQNPAYIRYTAQLNERTDFKHIVADFPAADVVPVRLGEWLDGYKMQTCSLCKCRGKKSWTFCPHCGARMIYGERKE